MLSHTCTHICRRRVSCQSSAAHRLQGPHCTISQWTESCCTTITNTINLRTCPTQRSVQNYERTTRESSNTDIINVRCIGCTARSDLWGIANKRFDGNIPYNLSGEIILVARIIGRIICCLMIVCSVLLAYNHHLTTHIHLIYIALVPSSPPFSLYSSSRPSTPKE